MSSALVTFNFKTFPKHRRTQFLHFLAQSWETRVRSQEVSVDFEKKLKNQIFLFFSKSVLTSCLQTPVSQICAKKFNNWVRLCFGNVLKLKVTKGELFISNRIEMADRYPHTHTLARVKKNKTEKSVLTPTLLAQHIRLNYWKELCPIQRLTLSIEKSQFQLYWWNLLKVSGATT